MITKWGGGDTLVSWFVAKFWPFIVAGVSLAALVFMGRQNTRLRIRAKNTEFGRKQDRKMRDAGDAVLTGRDDIRNRLRSGNF